MSTSITLVGAGYMGSAMLSQWLNADLPYTYNVIAPNPKKEILNLEKINQIALNNKTLSSDILVLAVKPQVFSTINLELSELISPETLVISIIAGIKIDRITSELGCQRIIRAMPNTPCSIGKGTTLLTKSLQADNSDLETAKTLMTVLGHVETIANEETLDIATAISGCGPAFVFMLTECMAQAGISQGLQSHIAYRLAKLTVDGAGTLLAKSIESPETLCCNVTSKGGITEAALKVLMAPDACPNLFEQAFEAIKDRNKALASS